MQQATCCDTELLISVVSIQDRGENGALPPTGTDYFLDSPRGWQTVKICSIPVCFGQIYTKYHVSDAQEVLVGRAEQSWVISRCRSKAGNSRAPGESTYHAHTTFHPQSPASWPPPILARYHPGHILTTWSIPPTPGRTACTVRSWPGKQARSPAALLPALDFSEEKNNAARHGGKVLEKRKYHLSPPT